MYTYLSIYLSVHLYATSPPAKETPFRRRKRRPVKLMVKRGHRVTHLATTSKTEENTKVEGAGVGFLGRASQETLYPKP